MIQKNNKMNKYFYIFSISICCNLLSDISQKLIVPENFEISVFAENLNTPRQITETSNGHIIVGSKQGNEIIAILEGNEVNPRKIMSLLSMDLPSYMLPHKLEFMVSLPRSLNDKIDYQSIKSWYNSKVITD